MSSDEPGSFERQHHLVNGRWADVKIFLHVGFSWRPAVQARVEVNKRQILALFRWFLRFDSRRPSDSVVCPCLERRQG